MIAGWNTWDVTTHTGMVHLPSGLRIRFGVPGAPLDGFTWRDGLVRLGHHTVGGDYAEVTVEAGDGRLHLVMAGGPADELYVRAEGTAGVLVAVDGWRDASVAGWRLDWCETGGGRAREGAELLPVDGLTLEFAGRVELRVAPQDMTSEVTAGAVTAGAGLGARVDAVLAERRAGAERSAPRSGGWLGDAADAATRAVTWNRIYGTFAALLAWHDWWPRARRGPHGLLAWGSDPVEGDPDSATLDRTKRESGLDDSPMYDDVAYDPGTRTMTLTDVGLVALHIADAEALAAIAATLGEDDVARRLRQEAAEARAAADPLLWDTARADYRNLRADGTHDPHISPTLLYPLLAGMPDPGRAAELAGQLLRPETLGGDPPLPSVARDDPGYAATYWRGRIWAPMAFLAIEGLRRYGLNDTARSLVGPLLRLFLSEWDKHSHVRENYPATSGEDVRAFEARSDGLMAWGGLLAYLAYGELADAREDGWRFAHPGEPAELAGLPLGDGRLTVTAGDRLSVTGDRLSVTLDGRPLLDAAPGVVVTAYRRTAEEVTGIAHGTGDLRVSPPGDGAPVRVPVSAEPARFRLSRDDRHDNDGGTPA